MTFIEQNGVKVNFPDTNCFQFDSCAAYQPLKGKKVKETDVCWFDVNKNTLWFVELKAFYDSTNPRYLPQDLSQPKTYETWIEELTNKSIHAVLMALTNRSNTQSCLTHIPDNQTKLNIVHLIRFIPTQDTTFLLILTEDLRRRLMPYQAIFNINSIVVVSYDFALANPNQFPNMAWIV